MTSTMALVALTPHQEYWMSWWYYRLVYSITPYWSTLAQKTIKKSWCQPHIASFVTHGWKSVPAPHTQTCGCVTRPLFDPSGPATRILSRLSTSIAKRSTRHSEVLLVHLTARTLLAFITQRFGPNIRMMTRTVRKYHVMCIITTNIFWTNPPNLPGLLMSKTSLQRRSGSSTTGREFLLHNPKRDENDVIGRAIQELTEENKKEEQYAKQKSWLSPFLRFKLSSPKRSKMASSNGTFNPYWL